MADTIVSPILVLDSWPVLEWLKAREPASAQLEKLIAASNDGEVELQMTRINYGEVVYSLHKLSASADIGQALADLSSLRLFIHSIDDALVDDAVGLKSKYAFAYADAFAAALAMRLGCPLVTGDQEYKLLEADGLLTLRWLGK